MPPNGNEIEIIAEVGVEQFALKAITGILADG
jgi:hypothetical protein